jgi:dihydrofolate reductase
VHTNTVQERELEMRKIVWSEYISLDGVVEEPGEWSIPYFSNDLAQYKNDELHDSDALLLGRTTYEGFAAAWPEMEAVEGEFAVRMNTLPKYVASTTLERADWNNSTIIRETSPTRSRGSSERLARTS